MREAVRVHIVEIVYSGFRFLLRVIVIVLDNAMERYR